MPTSRLTPLYLPALLVAVPLVAAARSPGAGEGKDPPPPTNVLVLVADDLGVELLSAYGPELDQPSTPVLDQLALDGVRFTHAWASPLCTPTRAALLTGRHSLRTGLGELLGGIQDTDLGSYGLPLGELTLPELLDQGSGGAWSTACIGKWHLGSLAVGGALSPNLAGFDYFAGTLGNLQLPENYFEWERIEDGLSSTETGYATTVQVDDALAFIGQATEPWLCSVNFSAPHNPFHAPPPELHSVDLSEAGDPNQNTRPYFKAMVEALDTELGRLLDGLGDDAAHTLVIFVTDNGTPTKAALPVLPVDHSKGSMFEGGIRVPLIVRGPGVLFPGSVCDALVDVTDVFATVADVAGIDPATVLPPGVTLDGRSLLPYLADPALPSEKAYVFSELFSPNGEEAGLPNYFEVGPLCQEDLGFGGPGSAVLSVCGEVLVGQQSSDLLLTGAPASSPAWFAASFHADGPLPLAGGFLVPQPATTVVPAFTDPQGEIHVYGLSSSIGPVDFYVQAAALDPLQPFGFAITNAVKLSIKAPNAKAVRDARFKLIRFYNGGPDELYDLLNDPEEEAELLSLGALDPEAEVAYQALGAELDAFIQSF
jgi:arylsulfatase A-like enzyme